MNPTSIILALVSRLGDLEKVIVAIKADVETLKNSASSPQADEAATADIAAQVTTVANDLAATGESLGLTGGLATSLLALIGGVASPVVHGVESLLHIGQNPAPATQAAAPIVEAPVEQVAPTGTAAALETVAEMKLVPPVGVGG